MKKYILSIATIAALSVTGSVLAAPITIDTFDDGGIPYIVSDSGSHSSTGTVVSTHAIGGSRTNQTDFVEGFLGGNTGAFNTATYGSVFAYSSDALTKIQSKITWDSAGAGLGGIDLTQKKALDKAYFSFNIIDIDQGSVSLGLTLEDTSGRTISVSSDEMVIGEDQRVFFSSFPGSDFFAFDSIDSIAINISQSSYASDFIFDSFETDFIVPPVPPQGTTPIPAAIWLFGSGLMGLVGMSKRKKNQGLVA